MLVGWRDTTIDIDLVLRLARAGAERHLTDMPAFRIDLVRSPTTRGTLTATAAEGFGDMLKAVVDVGRGVMRRSAESFTPMTALLDDGSRQKDLWGINPFPGEPGDTWLEFDSMINVRPAQGNRTRGVDDSVTCDALRFGADGERRQRS